MECGAGTERGKRAARRADFPLFEEGLCVVERVVALNSAAHGAEGCSEAESAMRTEAMLAASGRRRGDPPRVFWGTQREKASFYNVKSVQT